ncbi:MAG: hypothetical protein FJ298_02290 [Planctomycetes bacterium]|nr:hypothetical protein [Planctomycetota bacterium]
MKLLLPLLLAAGSLAFLAPSQVLAPQLADEGKDDPQKCPLEQSMEAMADSIRALRRSLRDPSKQADSLAGLAKLEADIVAAKSQTPRRAAKLSEAERPRFVADYRSEMIRMLEQALVVEKAVLGGQQEAALAAFEELRGLEDPAHARFTEEEQ